MKAKCPHCTGPGCVRCEAGSVEVTFARGDWKLLPLPA